MEETEVKLSYKDRRAVMKLLITLGARKNDRFTLTDAYFSSHGSMSKEHEIVRIRKRGAAAELTFKGRCEGRGAIWRRTEITTPIAEPQKMAKMLQGLGLKMIKENRSEREMYELGDLEIAFIDFSKPAKLSLIEVEGPGRDIKRLLKALGTIVTIMGEDAFRSFDRR